MDEHLESGGHRVGGTGQGGGAGRGRDLHLRSVRETSAKDSHGAQVTLGESQIILLLFFCQKEMTGLLGRAAVTQPHRVSGLKGRHVLLGSFEG